MQGTCKVKLLKIDLPVKQCQTTICIKSSTLSQPKWNKLLLLFHNYKQNENTRNKLTNELWIGWQRIVCRMLKCMLQSLPKLCHVERLHFTCSFQASKHTYFFFQFTFNMYICLDLIKGTSRNFKCILTIWPLRLQKTSWKSLVRA